MARDPVRASVGEEAAIDGRRGGGGPEPDLIAAGDDWGHHARGLLAGLPPAERAAWVDVLTHAATARGTVPGAKWLAAARRRIDALGEERFRAHAVAWLGLLDRPARRTSYAVPGAFAVDSAVIAERNATLLRGLAWCCALVDGAAVARALGDAAVAAYTKVPEVGPRSAKAANAFVWALGALACVEAATQLQRLARRVTYQQGKRLIDEALGRATARAGLTRDDLDDLAVPALGLAGGRLRRIVGGYTVEVEIVSAHRVDVHWFGPDGVPRAAEPAALKREHREELEELRRTVEDIRTQLSLQRQRIERILLSDRSWTLAGWRARWLDHPLLSFFARRLIWAFEPAAPAAGSEPQPVDDAEGRRLGAWLGGALVGADDRPLDLPDAAGADSGGDVRVRLWHPITSDPATALAWRAWLDRHGVTQPFKQAHRELYVLTDAERQAGTYSNRFRAHLLRQHQLQALCRERGWTYRLQGAWDGHNNPSLDLPRWGIRAELGVEAPDNSDSPAGALSRTAVNLYVATDQVRFSRLAGGPPLSRDALLRELMRNGFRLPERRDPTLPLADVPPLVFSEVMRDVDLFVGVCSAGTAPAVEPRWPARLREYWEEHAFGSLSEAARTRRDVLERLLPRLAIAPRCALTDRFLEVRGGLHTYRIHLGSANIIMDDGRYLCIVPAPESRSPGAEVALPFEGDGVLSLILSKAFLLAEDRAITDPSILSQL